MTPVCTVLVLVLVLELKVVQWSTFVVVVQRYPLFRPWFPETFTHTGIKAASQLESDVENNVVLRVTENSQPIVYS